MAEKNSLSEYKNKRDLDKSPEPKGKVVVKKKQTFVIQKHDASHLHYDFRISIGGVLKSWAVPKGPSLNPKYKRLAIQTDDHPMDYANFEGVIPEGNYGAGIVMVWDKGTYKNLKDISMEECYRKGVIEIWLDGEKIQGGYALRKFGKDKKSWLLIKMRDEKASVKKNPVNTKKKSVLTVRTLKEIEREES